MFSRQYLFKKSKFGRIMLCSSRTRQVKQLQTVQIPGNRTHAGVTQLVTQERGHSGLPAPMNFWLHEVRFWLPVIWSKAGCGWQGRKRAHESQGLLVQSLRGRRHPSGRDERAVGGQLSQQSAAPHARPTHSTSSFSPTLTSRASRKRTCRVWKDYRVALAEKHRRGRSLELDNEISCL